MLRSKLKGENIFLVIGFWGVDKVFFFVFCNKIFLKWLKMFDKKDG